MNVRPPSLRVFELRTTVNLCRHYECSISGFPAGAILRVLQVKNNLCFYGFRASPVPWRSASATLRRTLFPGQRRPPQGKIGSPSSGESQRRHERATHPKSGFLAFVKIFQTVAISVGVIIFATLGFFNVHTHRPSTFRLIRKLTISLLNRPCRGCRFAAMNSLVGRVR